MFMYNSVVCLCLVYINDCIPHKSELRETLRNKPRLMEVRMWTDFDEICQLKLFRKSVEKIQVSLKSDKINEYFA